MSNEIDLAEHFPKMTPIDSVPTIGTIWGCGFSLYFERDVDPLTGAYVTTRYFTLLFIPLIALGAYRVAHGPSGEKYILGREPLSGAAKGWSAFALLSIAGVGVGFWWHDYVSSPDYVAGRKMAKADDRRSGETVRRGRAGSANQTFAGSRRPAQAIANRR